MTSESFDRSRPTLRIDAQFDRLDRIYAPGAPLTARYWIAGIGQEQVRSIERSVDWYTEGKGEEDLGVHFFERIPPPSPTDAVVEGTVTTTLPASPLSYEGVIVKVRWCLRVRVFFTSGRDFVSEHVFAVGDLPPARPAAPATRIAPPVPVLRGEPT
jgi:hypothetical protein